MSGFVTFPDGTQVPFDAVLASDRMSLQLHGFGVPLTTRARGDAMSARMLALVLVLASSACFSTPRFVHNESSRFHGCYRGTSNTGSTRR